MALLTDPERLEILRYLNAQISAERLEISITRPDLAAAIAGIDSYFDTNAAAINTAIPQPARGALSARQKALLVIKVIRARYGV